MLLKHKVDMWNRSTSEAGHYYCSDHFSLVKVGVAALDASSGIDVEGKGKEYGKKLQEDYTANHYHRPSDTYAQLELLLLVYKIYSYCYGWKTIGLQL